MRFFLVLLAVIGLLTSPAVAAAAQARCHCPGGDVMTQMAKAEMPGNAQADTQKGDPCCDPGKDQGQTKHSTMECALACAAMCGVVAALPITPTALVAPPERGSAPQVRVASLKSHESSRLERPPKLIV